MANENIMRTKSKVIGTAAILLFAALIAAPRAGVDAKDHFVPPDVASATDIPYPVEVLAAGLVTLSVNLSATGQPDNVRVLRDIPGLTSVASSIVKSWSYTPGKLDGKPAPSTITIEVVFNPGDTLNENLKIGPVAPTPPPLPKGYLPPEIAVASYVAYPVNSVGIGAVVLDAAVDKYSEVKKVDILRDVPSLSPEAIATMKRWTINPATFSGKPIPSKMIVAFVFRSPTMTTR
jgi:Gram-negative bacterial TonB protein C-terminal